MTACSGCKAAALRHSSQGARAPDSQNGLSFPSSVAVDTSTLKRPVHAGQAWWQGSGIQQTWLGARNARLTLVQVQLLGYLKQCIPLHDLVLRAHAILCNGRRAKMHGQASVNECRGG